MIKYETIILILGVLVSLIYLVKIRHTRSAIIVIIQVISVGLTFVGNPTFGYYVFGIAIILSLLYPVLAKEKNLLKRRLIWLFLFPILAVFAFGIFDSPGYNYLKLSLIITFFVFFYAIKNRKEFKYEIGFMILFMADVLTKFIGFFH